MTNDTLQNTLQTLLQSGTTTNPALNKLISDYTEYHVVLVAVGGLFLLGLILLNLFLWMRFKSIARADSRKWTFEKKTYFYFGASSVLLSLFMALIFVANVSTALNARQEFSVAVNMLEPAKTGTQKDQRYQLFRTWLQSGISDTPSLIQSKINNRLGWQLPKAIICSVLLMILVMLSARVWRILIRGLRGRKTEWNLKQRAFLLSGVGTTVVICFLPMLMVIGNTQASFAPIFLTLTFG